MNPTSSKNHILTLDGLRGIAALLIMIGHLYPKWLISDTYPLLTPLLGRILASGGFRVQFFFVLSGYLLTSILLRSKSKPNFFVNFYARRTLRIFPLYYGSLAFVLFILPTIVPFDSGAQSIYNRQLYLWLYMANWPTGWVWDDSSLFLLGHFWTLSVEQHFALAWPFIVSKCSPKTCLQFAIALFLVGIFSELGSVIFTTNLPIFFHWNTLHRLDGLAVGSILAITLHNQPSNLLSLIKKHYGNIFKTVTVISILYIAFPRRLNHPTIAVFGEIAVTILFGLIIFGSMQLDKNTAIYKTITCRIFVEAGKYSYGLYVIHGILRPAFEKLFDLRGWPTSHGLPFLWMILYYLLTIGTTMGLAVISYHWFEARFLSLKRYFEYAGSRAPSRQPA